MQLIYIFKIVIKCSCLEIPTLMFGGQQQRVGVARAFSMGVCALCIVPSTNNQSKILLTISPFLMPGVKSLEYLKFGHN